MSDSGHRETRGDSLLVISIVLLTIANVSSVSRLAIRAAKKQLGMDDYVSVLATITLDIQTAFVFCSIHYGFGKHGADLAHDSLQKALMYFYLIQVMYKILGGFAKAAFVLLYIRIFANRRLQWFAKWIVMTAIISSSIAFTFGTIFQCQPLELAWNKKLHGTCINNEAFWYSHAAVHTFLDLVIFSMPIPLVWKLQMPLQKRIGLICLFILGFFGCIASIMRMTALDNSSKSHDPTWGSYKALLWTVVEANLSVICACLPPLRGPAFQAIRYVRGRQGTSSNVYSYDLKELPASYRRQRAMPGDTEIGDWQNQVGKSGYAIKTKDSPNRSASQESIVPHAIPGITKTTQWEVLGESESSHHDDVPS